MPKNSEAYGAWIKPDKPEHIIGFLLKSLQHTLRQTLDEALRKQGLELSFAHLAALFGLHYEPGSTGAKLARRAFVSAQTMNSVLRRLEADGLIERGPHPDSRRADSWTLTAQGRVELERARAVGSEIFARMLGPLDAAETANFESYLRRCITALEGAGHDANDAIEPSGGGDPRLAKRVGAR
jgi:DNA-binding MarR family transcriptional regulator